MYVTRVEVAGSRKLEQTNTTAGASPQQYTEVTSVQHRGRRVVSNGETVVSRSETQQHRATNSTDGAVKVVTSEIGHPKDTNTNTVRTVADDARDRVVIRSGADKELITTSTGEFTERKRFLERKLKFDRQLSKGKFAISDNC